MLKRLGPISKMSRAASLALVASALLVSPFSVFAQQSPTQAPENTIGAPSAMPGNSPANNASTSGINIQAPPPPSSLSPDAAQLGKQLEEEAARAQAAPPITPPAGQITNPAQAQAAADAMQEQREQEHIAKSFERAEKGLLPLSTDQIRDFMRRLEVMQKGSQAPAGGPPKPDIRTATLSLDPGVDPPVVNLVAGYVTTITMIDSTGEPWPILDVGVGAILK